MGTDAQTLAKGVSAGGSSGLGLGVLICWVAGHFGLVDLSAEAGSVVGALAASAGAAIGTYGILGCCRRIIFGRRPG